MTNPNRTSMHDLPSASWADLSDPVTPNFDYSEDWSPTSFTYTRYVTVKMRRFLVPRRVSVKVEIERTPSAPRVTVRAGCLTDHDLAWVAEEEIRMRLVDGIERRWAHHAYRCVVEIVWPMDTEDGEVPLVPPRLPAPSPDLLYHWAEATAMAL